MDGSIPVLSSLRFFDLDDGFEERVLGLRFDSEAEGIDDGEAKWGGIVGKVSSSHGVRDVDGEGDSPTGGFNANGTTATINA
jgi:hypothetical protein